MKVLHIITGLSRSAGGPARSSQGLVAALCKAGVDTWIYSLDGTTPWMQGVRSLEVWKFGGLEIAVREFDLVHIHGIWSWKLHKVAVMCRRAGVPYVIAPRGMLESWSLKQKWLKKRIARLLYQDRDLKLAAALHATAESEAEQFRRLGFKNKIIISPNGVNVPEGDFGTQVTSRHANLAKSDVATTPTSSATRPTAVSALRAPAVQSAFCQGSSRRVLAERKVEEWLSGVTEESFRAALERLVEEKSKAGEYLFEKQEDKTKAIAAARLFFSGYSRKLVELSDGRCVYFVPDPRSKMRHADISTCWAEYAFHAVSSGGNKIPGKNYNYRKYSEYKVVNTDLIEDTLKSERCVPVLRDKPSLDSVKFFGSAHLGGLFDVVARLDECGNANANMTEVTFEASTKRGQKKPPQLVSLAEAIRTVVSHQTATGTYPSDANILPNQGPLRNGGRRALFVSRMHPKKGVLELVESWARVKPKGWCCELVYTMNSDEERAYEQKVKDRILSLGMTYVDDNRTIEQSEQSNNFHDFIFTGPLDDEKKWFAYARADLFVLPTYSENFGIVVAEALWAGVPVITTKGTPWAELEDHKCGWWIGLPSAEVKVKGVGVEWNALDSALREACGVAGVHVLSDMGRRGHELVGARYTWSAVCEKMIFGYREVLGD